MDTVSRQSKGQILVATAPMAPAFLNSFLVQEMEVVLDLMASGALDQLASLQVDWQLASWEVGAVAVTVQATLAGLQDSEARQARQAIEFFNMLQGGQVNRVITRPK